MNLLNKLKKSILVLDGAMGTMLQSAGLPAGTPPEEWNLTNPEKVAEVHRAYLEAGADVICANTFGINPLKYGEGTEELVRAAIKIAKSCCKGFKDKFVALDLGPCGKLLKPLGGLDFEDAVTSFKRVVKAAADAGADLVFVETMNDVYEAKAAVLAAKEASVLPVFACCVFNAYSKTMTGASPEAVVALLEGLGVEALGLNCSLAPREMKSVAERLLKCASVPVIAKPNAGMPCIENGKTFYSVGADGFTADMLELVNLGVRCVGGCCGTSPEYIKKLSVAVKDIIPAPVKQKNLTVISSYTDAVYFGDRPLLIGERINPTGKKRLKQALKEGDIAYVLNEAVTQAERGVHALDVNVGLPEIDEAETLTQAVAEIQSVTDLPLQIDTSDPVAMERAMRVYNGKPLVNSVNGKTESMQAVFPLVKKYGGAVIALTLDEGGIPATAEGRIKIALNILKTAKEYGIKSCDMIFDTLTMAVSADSNAAVAALDSLSYIKNKLGINTSLGVSNISFGLPNRDFINSAFFAMALNSGLSAAIMNPNSHEMMKTYYSYLALAGKDENCLKYIEYASRVQAGAVTETAKPSDKADGSDLKYCIIKGLKAEASVRAQELLKSLSPLEVIDFYIIPALDDVGQGFENNKVFLPQLLMSAEAASAAFGVIKSAFGSNAKSKKLKIVLATVKGDIHDIGKNIVKTLLENYGFSVCDLGRDVDPQSVADAVKKTGAKLVGLSALMTTTVGSMRETIALLRKECPDCKVIVGGAVLTKEYAEEMGADGYGKDAMSTVRFAENIEAELNG